MNYEDKLKIMSEIQSKSRIYKRVSPIRVRIRCPLCGDHQSKLDDAHCYIKCSEDPTEPIQYYCFLCNKRGIVGKKFLSALGIDASKFSMIQNTKYNKIQSFTEATPNDLCGKSVQDSIQCDYICNRLGHDKIVTQSLDKFRIVWDFNLISPYISEKRILNMLPSNNDSITFLSDDKAVLLCRSIDSNGGWRKIRWANSDRSFYMIQSMFDLFSRDDVHLVIAEGIFDLISAYLNKWHKYESVAYIAVLGSGYESAIDYAICKGIIGSNVSVHVYMDSDKNFQEVSVGLKRYKWLFKGINLYQNILYKDIGVRSDLIKLKHVRL